METIIRLKKDEFDINLINTIRKFLALSADSEIVISITKPANKNFLKKETRSQMKARIDRAIDDVENQRNLISFSAKEFEKLTASLSGK